MQIASDRSGRAYAITRRPLLTVMTCVLGFAVTTVHNTLPGAFPAMFLRGALRLGPTQIGILSGILYAGAMLSGPMVGRLADSVGRRGPLVGCAGAMALGTAGMALAFTYPMLLVARLLCGFGVGGAVPLLYAYLIDVLPERWRGPSSLGMAASGGATAFIVLFIVRLATASGPDSWRIAMWGFAVLAVMAAASFALIVDAGEPAGETAASSRAGQASAAGVTTDHRRALVAILVTASCVAVMNTGFFVIMVPILLARGLSEQDALAIVGIAVAASMLSLALAALISNRVPRYLMLSGGAVFAIVALAMFALANGGAGITLGAAGTVFGAGLCFGAVPFYAAEAFPETLRGRVTGVVSGVMGVFTMVMPVIVNLLFERGGEVAPLALVAASMLLVPAVLLPFGPRTPVAKGRNGDPGSR